jgi:cobalt-zinc-cadmium efflux system outer membrane protein
MRCCLSFFSVKKPIGYRFFKMATGRLFCASLAVGLPTTALAQAVKPPAMLSLEAAISLTLQQHPELRVFAHQRKAQAGYVQQAGITSRPIVEVKFEDAMGTGEHSNIQNAQSTINITWVLEQDVIKRRIEAAEVAATAVSFEQQIKALDLAAQTARWFVETLIEKQRLQLARLAEQQAERTLGAITARVEAGKGAVIEQLQAQAQLVRQQLAVEDHQHELKSRIHQLVAQWRGDVGSYQPEGNLLNIPVVDNFEQQLNKISQHPALKALANQQRVIGSAIELARIEAKPQWRLSTGLRRYESSDDFGLVAGLSIPFGEDRRSAGKIISLKAQQAEHQSSAQALSHRLNTQLYVLLQEIDHSRHVIETLTDKVIPLLEDARQQADGAYDIGKISYLQIAALRQEWLAAQSQLLDAYLAIHLEHIEIQRLTGTAVTIK